ncbi:MAG TPA: hypothetical protein VD997_04865 [Phycisphaerales bacterium]|nr:hypothetical protein [Phycisphaerales bacterium]
MATESSRNRIQNRDSDSRPGAYLRREDRVVHAPRNQTKITFKSALEELTAARAKVQALESRPRARCRVSQVQTTLGSMITSADEVLGLLLRRPVRALVGTHLPALIAGPERKLFAERAKALMEGPEGGEWETRIIAPGALVGVPVAISIERGPEGTLNWYIRDLSELRQAQARVMQLEQIASTL